MNNQFKYLDMTCKIGPPEFFHGLLLTSYFVFFKYFVMCKLRSVNINSKKYNEFNFIHFGILDELHN